MIGDVGQGRRRGRLGCEPRIHRLAHRLAIVRELPSQATQLLPPGCVRLGALRGEEPRNERRLDHGSGPSGQLEDVVGDVPRHVAEGPRVGVREQDRGLGDRHRSTHRVLRGVRQVDERRASVQLTNHLFTEARQPAVGSFARGGIRPVGIVVVREGHVARAERGEDPQRSERVPDRVAALDAEHRRDLSNAGDPFDVIRGARELESLRVPTDQLEERIDLLEALGDGPVGREVRGHEHGPELSAHRAGPQPRGIGVQLRTRCGGVEHLALLACLAERPQEVVVPIDQGSFAKEIGDRSHAVGQYATSRAVRRKRGGDANGCTR